MRAAMTARDVPVKYPIRGIFAGCCAAADRQSAKNMAHSRIADLRLRNADLNLIWKESINPRSIVGAPNPKFKII
jgi:hypothetical protein